MRSPSETSWLDSEVTRLPRSRYLKRSTILSGVIAAIESGCSCWASESTCEVTVLVIDCILLAATVSGVATGSCNNNLFNSITLMIGFVAAKVTPIPQKKP